MITNCFFEMVKKWTVKDYMTPGIKAEVILDMLISEFVEDLIQYHYSEMAGKAKLLTKEFPLRTNDADNRNAKVDYLVSIGKEKMILVELKTTKDSFSRDQFDRMQNVITKGTEELLNFYYGIIQLSGGNKLDNRKYNQAFEEFCNNLKEIQLDKETIKSVIDLDYLYISLVNNDKLPEKKLILLDYCQNEKFEAAIRDEERRKQWKCVKQILIECAEFVER